MYFIRIAVFAALWSPAVAMGVNQTQHIRRGALQEIQCLTLLKHILYEKDAVDKGLPTEWDCQILHPFSDGGNGNILKLEGLDAIGNQGIVDEFESGVTSIIIPGGTIEGNSIVIPPNAPIRVDSNSGNEQGIQTNASVADNVFQDHVRHLLEGKKKVIAIRVVDSNGVKLSSSPSQISDSIFGTNGDPHNLVSRYDDCSFGKLRMEPVEELNSGDPSLNAVGVYEVRISASANNVENSVIREKVTDQLNIDWPSTRLPEDSPGRLDSTVPFDYAMYCLPPGTKGSWIAYAYTNSWLSVYNGKWCEYMSVSVHEVAHNLNLGHSGDGKVSTFPESVYGDQSGLMGFSYGRDDSPIMCFNSAKSWQLGWYSDKSVVVAPFASGWTGRIMGIADYEHPAGYTVLLKIETGNVVNYYLNFNRKRGVNSGTVEGANRVLITTQGKDGSNSKLWATLSSGATYTVNNFANSGRRVRFSVGVINLASSPGFAEVTVAPSCTSDAQCQQRSSTSMCSFDNWVCNTSTKFCQVSNQGSSCNCDYQCNTQLETATECPSDCGQRLNLLTTSTANNGNAGNMFDVRGKREIVIIGFNIHARTAGKTINVAIYTKTGSYHGFEKNPGAWTLIQTASVSSKGNNVLTTLPFLPEPLRVGAGAIQAFYITLDTGDLRYTDGRTVGRRYTSDSNLEFFEGVGNGLPAFGKTFAPRVWNGRIKYVPTNAGTPTSPTPKPTPSPTPNPTPTPQTSIRSLDTTMNHNNGQAGCMFTLQAKKEIEIAGFEIHARTKGKLIKTFVYTKNGTYKGSERNAGAWNRIQISVLYSNGLNALTTLPLLSSPVRISKNNQVSFYVTLETKDMKYTVGTQEGAVYVSNGDVKFMQGTGNTYLFGTVYSPRIFNGRIKYRVIGNAEVAPTAAPTVTADLQEFAVEATLEPSFEPTPLDVVSMEPSIESSVSSLVPSQEE